MSDESATAPAAAGATAIDGAAAPAVATTTTTTTAESTGNDSSTEKDDDPLSRRVTLADLCARAAAQYAHRSYEAAADTYAQAAQLQAELRGDLDPENAEILFLYGRALFKVGQAKSSILGGNTAKLGGGEGGEGGDDGGEDAMGKKVREALGLAGQSEEKGKGLVQLEDGMDEEEDGGAEEEGEGEGEDEEGEGEGEGEGEEGEGQDDEDDLEAAFQALDLAGVLFKRKLEALSSDGKEEAESAAAPVVDAVVAEDKTEGKEKDQGENSGQDQIERHVKERLGDTHDILAEIHLENERFPHAVDDCRRSLEYKLGLYAPENSAIAEAHFKLSLALEFASLAPGQSADETAEGSTAAAAAAAPATEGEAAGEEKSYDKKLRDEAADALEAAIASTKLKLQSKEVELATSAAPDENEETRAQIVDVKEMISEMEERLVDLRRPPQSANITDNLLGDAVAGFAKALGGKSAGEQAALLEEAIKGANDLTSLVRKKGTTTADAPAPTEATATTTATATGAKRKASHDEDDDVAIEGTESKKARVEDA